MLKNAYLLILRTLMVSLIGFFSVRELLRIVGAEEFGLLNLVFGIATLFTFLNAAMITSNQRYFASNIGTNNDSGLKKVWGSSLILHIGIAVLVFLVLYLSKNYILTKLLVINTDYILMANYIYIFAIFSVIFSILQTPFNALVLASEKMKFFSIVSLIDAMLKLIILYFLYFFEGEKLFNYVKLFVLVNVITLIIYVFYCIFILKRSILKLDISYENLKELFFYSSWNIFGNFAFIFKLQGINVVLNIFFGLVVNSAYFLTNTIVSVVNNLVNSVSIAFNPQIYKNYARSDYIQSNLLIMSSSKYSFYFAYLFATPIIFNTEFVLSIWLHEIPEYTVIFVQLALINLIIDSLSGGLMTGIQATGKIKLYQIVVSLLVLANLPLSYFLLKIYSDPVIIYWVAIILAIFSFFARLYFINKVSEFSLLEYSRKVIKSIFFVVLLSQLILYFMVFTIFDSNILNFIFSSLFIVVIIIMMICFVGLDRKEKGFIMQKIIGFKK